MASTPSNPVILLDTPIVAGSFAVSKKGSHVDEERQLWKDAIIRLARSVSAKCMIRVPTPVCYELMAMNREWHDFITSYNKDVFRFASASISNAILQLAAKYFYSANCVNMDGEKDKLKTMDPIIAAYCIAGRHYLLTTNQQDFPESHFHVVNTEIMVLSGKNGKYRRMMYLLKPILTGTDD